MFRDVETVILGRISVVYSNEISFGNDSPASVTSILGDPERLCTLRVIIFFFFFFCVGFCRSRARGVRLSERDSLNACVRERGESERNTLGSHVFAKVPWRSSAKFRISDHICTLTGSDHSATSRALPPNQYCQS